MKAYLRVKGLWLLVNGTETRPKDPDGATKWDVKADKAAGELYLACSVEQRTHIEAVQDDPVKIWATLASTHLQKRPGARFNAWDDFFSIRKQPDESLSTLIARIEDAMARVQELRPTDSKTAYTIKELDQELVCMAMVRSLGEEYSNFASSLMLLKSLDKEELKAAFLAEETQRRRRPDGSGVDSALFTASGSCRCGNSPSLICNFCEKSGHCTHQCLALKSAKEHYKKNQENRKAGRSANRRANKASETPSTSPPTATPSPTTTTPSNSSSEHSPERPESHRVCWKCKSSFL